MHRPLDLVQGPGRVDDLRAYVPHHPDLERLDPAVGLDPGLHDLGEIAGVGEPVGDAQADPRRQGAPAPARPLAHRLQHPDHPPRIHRAALARLAQDAALAQQGQLEGQGVLAGGMGQLVDEAHGDEGQGV